jgi:hypothetical protein
MGLKFKGMKVTRRQIANHPCHPPGKRPEVLPGSLVERLCD